jgi:small-conductance mechanosensitive channel
MLHDFLQDTFLGSTLLRWALATTAVILITSVLRLINSVIQGRLEETAPKTASTLDDMMLDLSQRTSFPFQLAVGVAAATYILTLPDSWDQRVRSTVLLVVLIQTGVWASGIVNYLIIAMLDKRATPDPVSRTGRNMLRFLGLTLVWCAVLLLCLDNLGIDVTTLIAGLGVTGVAVALATQNIVGDLFASVSILLDKPFLVGDFIIIDNYMGTVERIGIKSTRIRSLGGEGIVFANSDLSKSRLRNYKSMQERRLVFTFSVRYDTPPDKLESIGVMVKEVVTGTPRARFDRAHWLAFGDNGLLFEVVYFALTDDYNVYMDIQQAINLGILRNLRAEGIALAYGTPVTQVPPELSTARRAELPSRSAAAPAS